MTTLPQIVNWLEADDSLHLARLLTLIDAFGGRQGEHPIEGLTKLAKLDFLLRYPNFLERALAAKGASSYDAEVSEYERDSVEARMVRYRFGPWDHRYRRFLNTLAARGLVEVNDGRPTIIRIAPRGRVLAEQLANADEYRAVRQRATLLKRHFDLTATNLMDFIYATFPEVISLRSGETIAP